MRKMNSVMLCALADGGDKEGCGVIHLGDAELGF